MIVNAHYLPQSVIFLLELLDEFFALVDLALVFLDCQLHHIRHVLKFGFELHCVFNGRIPLPLDFLESGAVKFNQFLVSFFLLKFELQLLMLVEKEHECGFKVTLVVVENLVVEVEVVHEVPQEQQVVGLEGAQVPSLELSFFRVWTSLRGLRLAVFKYFGLSLTLSLSQLSGAVPFERVKLARMLSELAEVRTIEFDSAGVDPVEVESW